jgi:branched-subunit amino acid aminotransferase/4-amino-4-deoxychorismate lyase
MLAHAPGEDAEPAACFREYSPERPVSTPAMSSLFGRIQAIISYQRNGYVPTSQLCLPFLDDISGTIRGYRIFTACRTVNGRIFRVDDHLERLYHSAESIYMQPPLPPEELREILERLVSKNREQVPGVDFHVEVIFSGGLAGNSMRQSGQGAHLYIAVQVLERPPDDLYRQGVALATFHHQRLWPDVKLLNYVGAIIGHQTVVPQHGAYDVLFVDPSDRETILEGSTFTVFFVRPGGTIETPPLDGRILDSITRRVILEVLGPHNGWDIQEIPITVDGVGSFSEAFIASTTRNVLPVVRINSTTIGSGHPGPVTRNVMQAFDEYVERY